MSFLIALLYVALLLNCLLLILLVLIQLPKKDAGAGLAFGGGATDALFGAGSGNALTKITKWSAGIFFGLSIMLSIMSVRANNGQNSLKAILPTAPAMQPATPPPASAAPAAPAPAPVVPMTIAAPTNGILNIPMPAPATTNGK